MFWKRFYCLINCKYREQWVHLHMYVHVCLVLHMCPTSREEHIEPSTQKTLNKHQKQCRSLALDRDLNSFKTRRCWDLRFWADRALQTSGSPAPLHCLPPQCGWGELGNALTLPAGRSHALGGNSPLVPAAELVCMLVQEVCSSQSLLARLPV